MKIDWKGKLSSRKLWTAVGAWLTSVLTAFNVGDNIIVQVGLIVSGMGALVVYVLAETHIDVERIKAGGE